MLASRAERQRSRMALPQGGPALYLGRNLSGRSAELHNRLYGLSQGWKSNPGPLRNSTPLCAPLSTMSSVVQWQRTEPIICVFSQLFRIRASYCGSSLRCAFDFLDSFVHLSSTLLLECYRVNLFIYYIQCEAPIITAGGSQS
jgi:hypothetical protein